MSKVLSIFFSAVAVALASCVSDDEPAEAVAVVGEGAGCPQFEVTVSSNSAILPASMRGATVGNAALKGSVAVLVFFHTGCGDCQAELPVLQQMAQANPEVKVLCIARDESEQRIATFWQTKGLTLPYSPQEGRDVYHLFATEGIPQVFVLDAQGVIRAHFDDSPLATLQQLNEAVAEAAEAV